MRSEGTESKCIKYNMGVTLLPGHMRACEKNKTNEYKLKKFIKFGIVQSTIDS